METNPIQQPNVPCPNEDENNHNANKHVIIIENNFHKHLESIKEVEGLNREAELLDPLLSNTTSSNCSILSEEQKKKKTLQITLRRKKKPHGKRNLLLQNSALSPVKRIHDKNSKHRTFQTLQKIEASYPYSNEEPKSYSKEIYNSDILQELENQNREKQMKINALLEENRSLLSIQRNQTKRIEELENLNDQWPSRTERMFEDLKVYKDKIRKYKEKEDDHEALSTKMHEQMAKLTEKNREYLKKLRKYDTKDDQMDSVLTEMKAKYEQREEKLMEKITTLEHLKKMDRTTFEKTIKKYEEKIAECQEKLQFYNSQLIEKEKDIRLQVINVKKLKKNIKELALTTQMNNDIYKFIGHSTFQDTRMKGELQLVPEPTIKLKLPIPTAPQSTKREVTPYRKNWIHQIRDHEQDLVNWNNKSSIVEKQTKDKKKQFNSPLSETQNNNSMIIPETDNSKIISSEHILQPPSPSKTETTTTTTTATATTATTATATF